MAITSAVFDPPCTRPNSDLPEYGHFLAVQMVAETGPAEPGARPLNPFNDYSFEWIDDQGFTRPVGAVDGPAGRCLPFSERFPFLEHSSKGEGVKVFDVSPRGGSLVYRPDPGSPGYEWGLYPVQ